MVYDMNLAFSFFMFLFWITGIFAQSTQLVAIDKPIANQQLAPGQSVTIQHTINGVPYNISSALNPNYPSSIKMILRWEEKNNSQIFHQLTALNSLDTDPSAGGFKNQVYSQKWKLPNQKFFHRYTPVEWNFILVFQPVYNINNLSSIPLSTNIINSPVQKMGPPQEKIIVPLTINLSSNTTSSGNHHKKNH